jgi:hypothetical protein
MGCGSTEHRGLKDRASAWLPSCPDYSFKKGARKHVLHCYGSSKGLVTHMAWAEMHSSKPLSTAAAFFIHMMWLSLVPFKGPKRSWVPRKVSILCRDHLESLKRPHFFIFKGWFQNVPPHVLCTLYSTGTLIVNFSCLKI